MGQPVTVLAHAVLQTTGFKPPLAAEPAVIVRALSLAGLGRADGTNNRSKRDKQHGAIVFNLQILLAVY